MKPRYTTTLFAFALVAIAGFLVPSAASADKRVVTLNAVSFAKGGVIFKANHIRNAQIQRTRMVLQRAPRRAARHMGAGTVIRNLKRGQIWVKLTKRQRVTIVRAYRATVRKMLRRQRALLKKARKAQFASNQSDERSSATSARTKPRNRPATRKRSAPKPKLIAVIEDDEQVRSHRETGDNDSDKVDSFSPELDDGSGHCTHAYGSFGVGDWPAACWRPYSAESPFNRQIPDNPPLASNSSRVVKQMRAWDDVQQMLAGHSQGSDYNHPIYYSRSGDPVYEVKCRRWASSCEVHGEQVRIPQGARPASGGDGHLAVIDQESGVEYDFWRVHSMSDGVIEIDHGGSTRIDGNGLGSNATAAHFGLAAGAIRGPEMLAGEINHALFAAVKCTSGGSTFPAADGTSGDPCSKFGLSTADAPPMGARLWLDMSDAQINALDVPDWKKTILRAMADYGVIIGDTMGGNSSWGIQAESTESYASFGATDPWHVVGNRAGASRWRGGYVFDLESGVNWDRHLKVVDPCVSAGTC